MKIPFALLSILAFLFLLSSCRSVEPKMDSINGYIICEETLNGAVLVSHGGDIIYNRCFGYADRDEYLPIQGNTPFKIGSLTKQFTAVLILMLQEDGLLSVNDPITDYIDCIRDDRLTIHHLLSHTSGLPEYLDSNLIPDLTKEYSSLGLIDLIDTKNLQFPPGRGFFYSNTNYILLALIIESVTGATYQEVLRERILLPCAMTNSGLLEDGWSGRMAKGYASSDPWLQSSGIHPSILFSAGGMYSTTEDLFNWHRALTGDLITKRSRRMLFRRHADNREDINYDDYGYGFFIYKSNQKVGHRGYIPGFFSTIYMDVSRGQCIVLLSNCEEYYCDMMEIEEKIIQLLR